MNTNTAAQALERIEDSSIVSKAIKYMAADGSYIVVRLSVECSDGTTEPVWEDVQDRFMALQDASDKIFE